MLFNCVVLNYLLFLLIVDILRFPIPLKSTCYNLLAGYSSFCFIFDYNYKRKFAFSDKNSKDICKFTSLNLASAGKIFQSYLPIICNVCVTWIHSVQNSIQFKQRKIHIYPKVYLHQLRPFSQVRLLSLPQTKLYGSNSDQDIRLFIALVGHLYE